MQKVEGRTREVILYLYTHGDNVSKARMAKELGTNRVYLHRIINKLEKMGIVNGGKLNRKKVKIVKFSWRLFKQYMTPVFIGILADFLIAWFIGINGVPLIIGGLTVFGAQTVYTFYNLLKVKENIEVWIEE